MSSKSESLSHVRARATPQLLRRELVDGVLLLNPRGGDDPISLDATGSEVWELLQQPCTLHEAAKILAARHDLPADAIESDITPLWNELAHRGFVDAVP